MNLLAHLHLSEGRSPAIAAGNLLADYVRRFGPGPDSEEFEAGIRLHRAIDAFADRDPDHRSARSCISAKRRRLAGVIVDVAFDTCLSRHWHRFATHDLAGWASERLSSIQAYLDRSESPLGPLLQRARDEGWLLAPTTPDGLRLTFQRVSGRSEAARGLRGAEEEVFDNLDFFEARFNALYPRLLARFASAVSIGKPAESKNTLASNRPDSEPVASDFSQKRDT